MNRIANGYCRLLEILCAGCLAVMVVLVFGNVVLRYAFNTGITVSEEVSRWLFVWMIFLGAIVALKERGHLGTDMMIAHLPVWGKKLCLVLTQSLMLWICWLLLTGCIDQSRINLNVQAPVTGVPVAITYIAGVVFAASASLMLVAELWRTLTGNVSDDQLVMVTESEEQAEFEALQARLALDTGAAGAMQVRSKT